MNANTILLVGLTAVLGVVEAVASPGSGLFSLDGLSDGATREARVRIRAALSQIGVDLSDSALVVTCSGAGFGTYDLAAAVAVLAALGRVPAAALKDTAFLGELSLSGALRPVRGVLPALRGAAALGVQRVVVPTACAAEAALAEGVEVLVAAHLIDVVAALNAATSEEMPLLDAKWVGKAGVALPDSGTPDLADIRGNLAARRALEIAAAGGHGLLLVGASGAGKTMLARRLTTILPPMTDEETLDVVALHSVAGMIGGERGIHRARPFRAPHHTCSVVGLVGGGDPIRPGEVSLAHNGVLLLDEVDQFKRSALDALKPALQRGKASIVRSKLRAEYPARPLVICAAGPCPCGRRGDGLGRCTCPDERVEQHRRRVLETLPACGVSMAARVGPVDAAQLVKGPPGESSAAVRERVVAARAIQVARYARKDAIANGEADAGAVSISRAERLNDAARNLLAQAAERMFLAPAQVDAVVRTARTIADLDGSGAICSHHVAEAICYVPEQVLS